MPEDIEKTIYRLEVDGSAYVAGVESLSASTNKFVQSQDSANKNLDAAKALQREYKEELKKTTSEIKENEKAVSRLAAANKFLQGSTSPEIRKKANDDLTTAKNRTEELKNKTVELGSKLDSVAGSIKNYNKEIKATAGHQSEISKALSKFTDLQHLAGEELSLASRRVARFGVDLAVGFGGALLGVAIPSVAKLAEKIIDLINTESQAEKQQKLLTAATDEFHKIAANSSTGSILNLEHLRDVITDTSRKMSERKEALIEYNKVADHANQIDVTQINNLNLINDSISRQIALIEKRALATASEQIITQAAIALILAKDKAKEKALKDQINEDASNIETVESAKTDEYFKSLTREGAIRRKITNDEDVKDAQAKFDAARNIAAQYGIDEFVTKTDPFKKPEKEKKPIQNIYEQELQKLRADIAKLDEKGFTDEATITKAIEEDFKKRSLAFQKALKNKQLTAGQFTSLQTYLKDLQTLTLNSQLKGFREQRAAYLQSINDELTNLQIEESTKRISTIQNLAERERQTIIAETEKTVNAIQQKRDKIIADITKNAAKNGLKPSDVAPLIEQIKGTYSKLLDDLDVIKNQKLQQLAFDTFEKIGTDLQKTLSSKFQDVSALSLVDIKKQTELFLEGKISYETYQKELTKIARTEADKRYEIERANLRAQIINNQNQLVVNNDKLTEDQKTKLLDKIRSLEKQLDDLDKDKLKGDVGNPSKKKLDTIAAYAVAIGAVVDSVIQFWQKANDAESKALDRSIALQEKRVDAAQRIAERGNAQYLKAEQDRLTELNVKRENAARKQLGIDAALQASQVLVGITGAISKIASSPFGAETIAEIAVIIGALATGFSIVKSLQGNQPHLAEGTTYVQRGKNKYGRDTIPAMLDEGEAVTSANKNKLYHPTIKAIHDGTIAPEALNNFVRNFHQIKSVPQPNYERIKSAAELHIGQDGRMQVLLTENNRKLDEHIDLQKQTIRTLKKMGVNVSLDQRGFAVTQMEVIEQMKIDKRI